MTTTPPVLPALGANQEGARQDEFLSVRTLAAGAAQINTELNLGLSGSRIRKLVRRFVREGRSDLDFYTSFIAYADKTGDTATRNVLRATGRHRLMTVTPNSQNAPAGISAVRAAASEGEEPTIQQRKRVPNV